MARTLFPVSWLLLLAEPALSANRYVEELGTRVARLAAGLQAANAALAEARESETDAQQGLEALQQQHSNVTIGPLTTGANSA